MRPRIPGLTGPGPTLHSPPVPRRLLAPALLAACFSGSALEGEPCKHDDDCGPDLTCSEDGLCGEFHCMDLPEQLTLENFAPDILLLVDYAATMRLEVDDSGTRRWDLTRALVERIADELGPRVNLGIQVVPTVDPKADTSSDPCFTSGVALIHPALDQGAVVRDALELEPAKTGEHALSRGLEFVLDALAVRPEASVRPQAIVLISDGRFNCSLAVSGVVDRVERFDVGLAERVASIAADEAHPIPVYVVGVDITRGGVPPAPDTTIFEVDRDLSFVQLAEAGRRARPGETPYYTPADADELLAALRAIPDAFADCQVPLTPRPVYEKRLAITIAGNTFKAADTCDQGRGWRYVDATYTRIELCGATCDEFRATRALTIDRRCPSA
jgi:hypothetical protein